MLLNDGFEMQEIVRRGRNWVDSSNGFIRENLNNGGLFYNRFNDLKDGPILNRGGVNGRYAEGSVTTGSEKEFPL